MRRRDFITLMGGAAAWPITVRAEQAGMSVIGILGSQSPAAAASNMAAFPSGPERKWLCRGQERCDRISLGRRP